MELWDWQEPDARRLTSEGKKQLAECWKNKRRLFKSPEKTAEAAELARRLKEPHWELFFRHLSAQFGLFQYPRPLTFIRKQCDRIASLAGEAEKNGWPEFFCGQEDLCTTLLLEDRPGNAAEVEALCEKMAKSDGVTDNHWFGAMLSWCDAALRARDLRAATLIVEGMRSRVSLGISVNPDNLWSYKLREARLGLAGGDVEAAERATVDIPPDSADAVQIRLALSEAFAGRGDWRRSRAAAEMAAAPSMARGLTRYAAEACLLSAEASAKLGDAKALLERAGQLAALLPKLGTRDLDARARALSD